MDAPTIYNFSPIDGSLCGTGTADPSPLEPGVWLFPAYSTTVAPPEAGEGSAAAFLNGAWTVVIDHRGESWFTTEGEERVVFTVGNPADWGLLAERPPVENHVTAEQATDVFADLTAQLAALAARIAQLEGNNG